MSNSLQIMLAFWAGFLDVIADLLMTEPYIYLLALFIGAWCIGMIVKIVHSH